MCGIGSIRGKDEGGKMNFRKEKREEKVLRLSDGFSS